MTSSSRRLAADDVLLIEGQAALDDLLREVRDEPLVALDTEAASFHRYHDRVYLLQLSTRRRTAVIDPLAVERLDPLGSLLADPGVEIVFHDADYDLRLMDRQYGFRARGLFDTRVAAQLLNEPGVGLAALLDRHLGVRLDKKYQRADWSARPLRPGMLDYAATDTHYLPELRDILRERLREKGRLAWAEEEFALLERVSWGPPEDGAPAFLRLKGARALRGRALAILRELWEWREATAERLDRAAFRILNNESILAMAQAPPAEPGELRKIPGISGDLAARRGAEILEAVRRGLAVPERDWPRIPRGPRRVPDPAFDERVKRLKEARGRLVAVLDLPPGVICPNGTLEEMARRLPRDPAELAEIPAMRKWQAEVCGTALLEALGD